MSTLVELAGFGLLVAAASVWQSLPLEVVTGLVAGGAACLFVGYSLSGVSVQPALAALRRLVARRRKVETAK